MGLTSVRKRAGRRLLTGLDYHLLKIGDGRHTGRIRDSRHKIRRVFGELAGIPLAIRTSQVLDFRSFNAIITQVATYC